MVEAWESGDESPTIGQLERLAYQLYKRPLAIFFFPQPPVEETPSKEFRTLPQLEIDRFEPDTLYALREARSMQLSLRELTENQNPAESQIFNDIVARRTDTVSRLTQRVRQYLGVDIEVQTNWPDAEASFKNWRDIVESMGVFVFKRAFKQADISAFCFLDPQFPIIYINNSTAFSRQIFSLFHELAHILFGTSGITKADTTYIGSLAGRNRDLEVACNRFAAEFLVPTADFSKRASSYKGAEGDIRSLAEHYNVSREVIFRRLLDAGLVDETEYKIKAEEWNAQFYKRSHQGSRGGNYYYTKAAYLGDGFLKLAFSQYNSGKCSVQQLAEHFDMKARNISKLESHVFGGV